MKYMSTRGAESGLSFEDVLLSGYASDGGLYMPENIPKIPQSDIAAWASLGYKDILKRILSLYISKDEIPEADIASMVDGAYGAFDIDEVLRVEQLKDGLNVAELFHGPTLTFKDLGLTIVAKMYDYFLEKRKRHMTVLVGTSGDTGSAAITAVQGLKWVDIVVLLPKGRCTEIQERQMTTVISDNVHNFAVEGTSDELDIPIKKIFADWEYKNRHNLCSINSLNWARVLIQMAHYIYCYYRVCGDKPGKTEVEFAVPTGACGNITGCAFAAAMGFPLRATAAVTMNDIVHRTLSTGDYHVVEDKGMSWASAMDISIAYNLERLFLLANGYDKTKTKEIMENFEKTEKVQLTEGAVEQLKKIVADSKSYTNDQILETIRDCKKRTGYTVCPHSATAVRYHFDHPTKIPRVCVACASPAKFPEALEKAGVEIVENDIVRAVMKMPTKHEWMRKGEDWEAILRSKIESITARAKANA